MVNCGFWNGLISRVARPNQLALLSSVCIFSLANVLVLPKAAGLAIEQPASAVPAQSVEQKPYPGPPLAQDPLLKAPEMSTQVNLDTPAPKVLTDLRRPVWALSHMVNSIKELDYRLGKGANAVEADVTFSREGDPQYTYHGPPCDCWRHCYQQEAFRDYLSYVRQITMDTAHGIGQNLTLLFLDLKLEPLDQRAKATAGLELAKAVTENLFLIEKPSPINANAINVTSLNGLPHLHLILSVNHIQDADLIHNFIHYLEINNSSHLLQRIGFDVGMNDDIKLIDSMWRRFGSSLNLWQGDGYTNCLSPFYNLERLTKALAKRDLPTGYPAKVYHWTIDLHDRIRESLLLGVDAVMSNHPERVREVLLEPEMAQNLRLASRDDNPFLKLTRDAVMGRAARSPMPQNGGFLSNVMDTLDSWLNYMREIPFLSLPSTLWGKERSMSALSSRNYRQRLGQPPSVAAQSQVTLVDPQSQSPKYSLQATATAGTQDNNDPMNPKLAGQTQESAEQQVAAAAAETYEGPKWYTSLASNLLVSMMKVFLPTSPPN